MITPGEIGMALLMVILWAFAACIWVITYTFYQDLSEWKDAADYAMVVIAGMASMALTVLLFLLTLRAMGIVEG